MDYSRAFPNGSNGTGKPADGFAAFDAAEAVPRFTPLPPGVYSARVLRGETCKTRAGADAYRMRFEIADGPLAGKTLIRTWSFSEKAIGYAKDELALFGLTTLTQLLSPFPEAGREYRVRLVVALQRGDDGREFNDIKRIELLGVDTSPAAAFLLPEQGEGGPK